MPKRTEGKHAALQGALVRSQGRTGIEHIQLQLQQIVLADLSHAAFRLRHFVKFLGIGQVLTGDGHILACQQEVEEMVDGGHGHLFGRAQESRLRLGITHRFDATVPLDIIHAENRLVQGQGHRHGHETVPHRSVQLTEEIERGIQRQGTSRKPDVLVDGELAIHLQVVVPHEGVRTVVLLIGIVTLVIGRQGSRKVHFRQQIGPEGTVFPISGLQLVQCHGGIHTLYPGQGNGFVQRNGALPRRSIGCSGRKHGVKRE